MRLSTVVCLIGVACFCPPRLGAAAVIKVVKGGKPGAELLRNGSFDIVTQGMPTGWTPAPNGFTLQQAEGRSGLRCIRCSSTNSVTWVGASQTLTLNRTNSAPLLIRGWSKSQNISGTPDSGYSLYVDVIYNDGTPLWGQTANFRCGTHDWQYRELLIFPQKPVKTITLHCILRGHSGTAWFDELSVAELTAGDATAVVDAIPVVVEKRARQSAQPAGGWLTGSFASHDGLEILLQGGTVESLRARKMEISGEVPSGFLVRDVASNSDFRGFNAGVCSDLSLRLQADCSAQPDHIKFRGKLTDTSGKDRAVTLYFALPVAAKNWTWGDDIRRSRQVIPGPEFAKTVPVGCGANGAMSLYPLGAIWNREDGLALGLDMNSAAQFRIASNPATEQMFIAFDFGLCAETERFPGSAEFSFVLFRFDPDWGFRAAFDKYMRVFPDHFTVRSHEQGIWMPFTDVGTVQGWEDFGFKYHEGVNNMPWDDEHQVLSFRYTEPMTWWMPMPKEAPRTLAEALKIRDRLAAGNDAHQRRMALVMKVAGMENDAGEPALSFRDTPWCNGVVWSINPNPLLPASKTSPEDGQETAFNGAAIYWNNSIKDKLYGTSAKGVQDGEYLDSLEGYVTADLNFRREHFRQTSVPLTFATDTKQLALFKGLAVYEFTRWLSGEVHALDKLMFANGVPYRLSFLCPWLDVLGTETDWLRDGKYAPASDEQMSLWRTMSGRKPYLLLMNTDYSAFSAEMVEKYFQRSLFYGMFPSMFSHNAADNPYWQNPKWYNRDRSLFKKYIPMVRKVSSAGWEPVTLATCSNERVYVERFGPGSGRTLYLSLLNDTKDTQMGQLSIDLRTLGLKPNSRARNIITGLEMPIQGGVDIKLEPAQAAVLEINL